MSHQEGPRAQLHVVSTPHKKPMSSFMVVLLVFAAIVGVAVLFVLVVFGLLLYACSRH